MKNSWDSESRKAQIALKVQKQPSELCIIWPRRIKNCIPGFGSFEQMIYCWRKDINSGAAEAFRMREETSLSKETEVRSATRATRRIEKLHQRKHQGRFGLVTYLVRRAPGLKQTTDRAEAKLLPTSLLRDPGAGTTVSGELRQREDAVRPAEIGWVSRGTSQVKAWV